VARSNAQTSICAGKTFGTPRNYELEKHVYDEGTAVFSLLDKYSSMKLLSDTTAEFEMVSAVTKKQLKNKYCQRFADSCVIVNIRYNTNEDILPFKYRIILSLSLNGDVKYLFAQNLNADYTISDFEFPLTDCAKLFAISVDCQSAIQITMKDKGKRRMSIKGVSLAHNVAGENTFTWWVQSESKINKDGFSYIEDKYIDVYTGKVMKSETIRHQNKIKVVGF
jgi:hypothetical protein